MTAQRSPIMEARFSEPERLLRDLEHMVSYWEGQAAREKSPRKAAMCRRKQERCVKMGDEVRRKMEKQREEMRCPSASMRSAAATA